ncbi:MAG: SIS domain-containing protein [Acidobacteria bacterium]|nr:SIS domain-containing protein [Acidobacteriota bacterium]
MSDHPGAHTLEEILSQPGCWAECLRTLDEKGQLQEIQGRFPARSEWVFVGCGSSYYIAQAAAASWTYLTGVSARAVPASEILLFPRLIFSDPSAVQPVMISRSGHTSEILKAAEYLELKENIRTLAVSCATHQPLEQISTATLYVLPADEKSMVMTRSFSSMLLSLQALAAIYGKQTEFAESLRRLPSTAQAALDHLHPRIQEFVQSNEFPAYVFLGQGPLMGVANESMLKVKEMSCSFAQSFHTLEFRHGPKAIVSPETLVVFLLSQTGYEAEREVLQDVKSLGGTTLVVANQADPATRESADLLLELNLDGPEYARLPAYVMAGQLMGLFTGVKKGLDPDRPRNLSRVVILNDNN